MQLKERSEKGARVVIQNLEIAESFWTRFLGLMGRSSLHPEQALWIRGCNSIHTFFMRFPIDVVFVDKQMRVVSCRENVAPYRFLKPEWKAKSVIEFAEGSIRKLGIRLGMEFVIE